MAWFVKMQFPLSWNASQKTLECDINRKLRWTNRKKQSHVQPWHPLDPRNSQRCLASMINAIPHPRSGFTHSAPWSMQVILLNIAWQGTKWTTFWKIIKGSSHRCACHFCCKIVVTSIPNCQGDTSMLSCTTFVRPNTGIFVNTWIFVRLKHQLLHCLREDVHASPRSNEDFSSYHTVIQLLSTPNICPSYLNQSNESVGKHTYTQTHTI